MPSKAVKTINLLVDNEFGVLTRITALVRREGFNIMSLAGSVTENPETSRIVIAVECVPSALPHVIDRIRKLDCVRRFGPGDVEFDLPGALREVFSSLDRKGGTLDD